jgi:hypothetical protein
MTRTKTSWRSWALTAITSMSVALTGCGSGSSSTGNASIRLANATLTHHSIDLLVNASAAVSGTVVDTVSNYVSPASGATTLQINDSGGGTALTTSVPTLSSDAHYTLLAYESGGTVKTLLVGEDAAAPASGTAQLRVYNDTVDSGRLDVYITDPTTDLATLSSPTATLSDYGVTGLLSYGPGTYRVRVTGYGNQNDLRMDIPVVTLANQQVVNIVLSPASGGILLDGSTILQQSTYAATRNTSARVRLAAAVSGNSSVAASANTPAGTTVIDSGSVAPAFGYYVTVPASSALNVSVNGQSVGAPASALRAGADATLLVYGDPGSATATLISDDNRLPADTTAVKLRLINGITGSSGTLTLTANSALVGNGIAPGAASSYVSVLGSTSPMNLSLTSSLSGGIFYTNTSNVLNAKGVYSVLAGGSFAAPQLLIR